MRVSKVSNRKDLLCARRHTGKFLGGRATQKAPVRKVEIPSCQLSCAHFRILCPPTHTFPQPQPHQSVRSQRGYILTVSTAWPSCVQLTSFLIHGEEKITYGRNQYREIIVLYWSRFLKVDNRVHCSWCKRKGGYWSVLSVLQITGKPEVTEPKKSF